jgi:hypothetical protein
MPYLVAGPANEIQNVFSRGESMTEPKWIEVIWHGPVRDVHYMVEAEDDDEAIALLSDWLCDPPEDDSMPEWIKEL